MALDEIINRFHESKIAVVGDVMLDVFWEGLSGRLSPEAPIPVVNMKNKSYSVGGAGNVASNIASLGGKAYLFGYIGNDEYGFKVKEILNNRKISGFLYQELSNTTTKIRIIAGLGNYGQQIARLDIEEIKNPPKKTQEKIISEIKGINPDVVVISDYAKGAITEYLMNELKRNYPVIVDPKPKNAEFYKEVYLITPNFIEGREMSGKNNVEEIGLSLRKNLSSNILLTRGHEGMTLFYNKGIKHFPTKVREVIDVCGAGDSVVASVALSLASGASLEEAAILANYSAGIVVEKKGTATVSDIELKNAIQPFFSKRKNLEELISLRNDLRKRNKKVVWTNGCFDVFHAGHAFLLREAKKQGDYLIVGLNNDSSVKKLKGPQRPFIDENNRVITLSNSEFVDAILVFSELNSTKYLKRLKPDVYVKGGDYNLKSINEEERQVIESYGGKIHFVPKLIDESTTKIAENIFKKINRV